MYFFAWMAFLFLKTISILTKAKNNVIENVKEKLRMGLMWNGTIFLLQS
jgi:hypothetical protein